MRTIEAATSDKIVNNLRQVLAPTTAAAQRFCMDKAIDVPAKDAPSPLALSLLALDRIEAALARIETAAPACVARDADLRRRHDELKASVAHSLAGLDGLLATRTGTEAA